MKQTWKKRINNNNRYSLKECCEVIADKDFICRRLSKDSKTSDEEISKLIFT